MFSKRTLSVFAALAAVAAVACDDSTTEPSEPLTLAESGAMFGAIFETFFVSDNPIEPTSTTAAGAVYPCPLGGQATASIESSDETVAGIVPLTTAIVLDPDACGLPSGANQFTLDGNPSLQLELNVTVGSPTMVSFGGSVSGGLDWQLDDRSGTCAVNVTYSVTAGQPDSAEISGMACGHSPPFPFGESLLREFATTFGGGG